MPLRHLIRAWTLLKEKEDVSTERGRSANRYRRALRTAGMNYLDYGVNVVSRVVYVPLLLAYLGNERYGVWVALSGFAMIFLCADFGMAAGLQNALSECFGRDDRNLPRNHVSTTLLLTLSIGLAIVALALLILPLIPVEAWIEVSSDEVRRDVLPTTQVLLVCFAMGIPASVVQRVYNAFQEGYKAKAWVTGGRIAGILGLVACVLLGVGLPTLAGVNTVLPTLALAAGGILLFRGRPWLAPRITAIRLASVRRVVRSGIPALGTRFGLLLASGFLPILVANRIGASDVPPYSVTMGLLWFPVNVISMGTFTLWPAYGEAAARGDAEWVSRTFRRTVAFAAMIMIPVAIVVPLVGKWIILIWTGKPEVVPDTSLLLGCTAWSVLFSWSSLCMVLLNGLDKMGFQALYGITMAVLALGAAAAVAPTRGVTGMVWTVVLVCGVPWAIFYGIDVMVRLRRLRAGRESTPPTPPPPPTQERNIAW